VIARWKALAQRIRAEVDELERTVSAVARHWQRAEVATEDQDAFLKRGALATGLASAVATTNFDL
jgi:hypothetical protein